MGRKLEFWFDFASTYSYLSAMRIDRVADDIGRISEAQNRGAAGPSSPVQKSAPVEIVWRPFLLGPIFKAQGWSTSPFNLYPAKGQYMIRDMERICAARGMSFAMPDVFPAHSVLAARVALAVDPDGSTPGMAALSRAIFAKQFAEGRDISDPAVLKEAAHTVGLDGGDLLQVAQSSEVRQALRDQTEHAQRAGIFGAPTFVTDDRELFWGDDRLQDAVHWCQPDGH